MANAWIADIFIVGVQNQDSFWNGALSQLAPDGKPLSPPVTGYTGGGLVGPGFGMTLDAADNVWITSTSSNTISRFDTSGTAAVTAAGLEFRRPAREDAGHHRDALG